MKKEKIANPQGVSVPPSVTGQLDVKIGNPEIERARFWGQRHFPLTRFRSIGPEAPG